MARRSGSPRRPKRRASPWKLGGLSVRELGGRVWQEIDEDELLDRAAALSYYFIFAMFPALLFLTTLVGLLPLPDLMARLMGYGDRVLPGDAATLVQKTLDEIVRGARGGLLSIGALAALWAGSAGMNSVMTALNVTYEAREPRPWWLRRLTAIALTVLFSMLTMLALILLVFGARIGEMLGVTREVGALVTLAWWLVQWPLALTFALLAVSLVYYLAPAQRQEWRWVTPGAVVAVGAWIVVSLCLRAYVSYLGNYNATYGSIGGVILLLLWFFLCSVALLVGAEVNSEIQKAARAGTTVSPAASPPRPAIVVRPPVSDLETEVSTAARVVEAQVAAIHRRGWTPFFVLAGASMVGMALSKRPVSVIAEASADTVRTGLRVAGAIAAVERFRARGGQQTA
jgi:membrane protein